MTDGPDHAHFAGDDYEPERDDPRLTKQLDRIHKVMRDGRWRTLSEIEIMTGDPQASILAQLGHLRKRRFGAYPVDKRHRGDPAHGLYEYHVGEKGMGVPKGQGNRSQLLFALEKADELIPYLMHKPGCTVRPCNCGFIEARKAWANARGATR